jgi:5'-3' exonuclease
MSETKPPCFLIDASIYIFRYYFSMPDNWFSEREGYSTAAVYGYSTFLLRLLEKESPQIIAACFDESLGSCFRNQIYPDYKSSRALPDEPLAFQLDACREVTDIFGIASFSSKRYEADDLLGTLVKKLKRNSSPISIVSRDKDLGQLLRRPQDFLWDYGKGEPCHAGEIQRKFGINPGQMVDYLALLGDVVDDIPGVPGIGEKTARALLQTFGDIDSLFSRLSELETLPIRGARNLAHKLLEYRQQIAMAKKLVNIVDSVPMAVKTADLKRTAVNWPRLEAFSLRMGLGPGFLTRARTALK